MQNDENANTLIETAGQIELNCAFNDDNEKLLDTETDVEMLQQEEASIEKQFVATPPKWTKEEQYEFSKTPVDLTCESTLKLYEKIGMILNCSVRKYTGI